MMPGTTQCPGPDMDIDWIVARAFEIWNEKYPPAPDPDPTTVSIDRAEAEEVLAAAEYTAGVMRSALGK